MTKSVLNKGVAKPQGISPSEIKRLRRRFLSGSQRPISQQRFSDLLGKSWSTVARWETQGGVDAKTARKLLRLCRALDAMGEMVKPEHRLAFFEQQHPLLLALRPIDLLDTEEGAQRVIELLEGAETGAFA